MASSSQVNRRRNRPAGRPDPMAEVISLSPKSLLDIHPFVCFICNKGFARIQNMQLHFRSHNLRANLHRRPDNGNRKRVYICPEPTCVYHHPSRALSDITGIKKHFSRRHSKVKNWKCQICSKLYAVESDLKAHMKKCSGVIRSSGARSSYSNGLSRRRGRNGDQEGRKGYLRRPSVGASSSRQPMPPPPAPSTGHGSPIISGPSRNANEFVLPAIADELTFTPILNGADSDEVVMAYNDAVYSIRQMQSMKLQPPSSSPSMQRSTSISIPPVPAYIDGISLELSLSLTPPIPPHSLTTDTHLNYHDHPAAAARANLHGLMNPGFNPMVGGVPKDAGIKPETSGKRASGSGGGEVSYDCMLKAMEEAMGLGGLNSGGYLGPFSDDDDAATF